MNLNLKMLGYNIPLAVYDITPKTILKIMFSEFPTNEEINVYINKICEKFQQFYKSVCFIA